MELIATIPFNHFIIKINYSCVDKSTSELIISPNSDDMVIKMGPTISIQFYNHVYSMCEVNDEDYKWDELYDKSSRRISLLIAKDILDYFKLHENRIKTTNDFCALYEEYSNLPDPIFQ